MLNAIILYEYEQLYGTTSATLKRRLLFTSLLATFAKTRAREHDVSSVFI